MGQRKTKVVYRHDFVKPIVAALIDFGYPDVTGDQVTEVLDAYIAGKRGGELPHGIIGIWAGRTFDELEEASPGALARLAA